MASTDTSALQLFLNRLIRRSRLTEQEQEAILGLPAKPVQVQANRDVVRMGDVVDHAYLVVDGLVAQFDQTSQGARQITALFIPGDMPDLHSVVHPQVGWALQALTTTTLVTVPHMALRSIAARHPAIAEAFWRDGIVDAAILSQWVVNLGRRDAQQRMAHLFCELAVRYEQIGTKRTDAFPFPITQAQLADVLGLTAVHVNRVLQKLRTEGVVLEHRMMQILDWKRLASLGDFDGIYLQTDAQPQRRLRLAE